MNSQAQLLVHLQQCCKELPWAAHLACSPNRGWALY